ncbi:class I SAM-dependent methyltransferase [Fusibacter ferrireducens]|uniref:Class I SAM-dependent methyltransferase n=1 Tax=Fusibacter ferrireducens TaxID=2785058 RepID=A0ABR9ZNN4_9FIRM|nr:class I SAM-dependent methyltransferase [Fusibacter ferrireducens]MBF4692072.1 class I SAM-dependent methyltransferase [Fusibacter ferrireducens]
MLRNKDYFNSKANSWDNQVKHNMDKVKQIMDLIEIRQGDHILDVGTGTGVTIPVLRSLVGDRGKITAIDEAEKMIEVAQSKFNHPNVEFVIGDVLSETFQDHKFDGIVCYSMFPHFEDKRVAISTLSKLLKKNGKLVICHSQSRDAINNLHKDLDGPVREDRLPTIEVFKELFSEADLNLSLEIDSEEMFVVIGTCHSIFYI